MGSRIFKRANGQAKRVVCIQGGGEDLFRPKTPAEGPRGQFNGGREQLGTSDGSEGFEEAGGHSGPSIQRGDDPGCAGEKKVWFGEITQKWKISKQVEITRTGLAALCKKSGGGRIGSSGVG